MQFLCRTMHSIWRESLRRYPSSEFPNFIPGSERVRYAIGRCGLALAVLWLALALGACAACARTQVSVRGDRAVVQLEASNAPLAEVLSALQSEFSIEYRTSVALDQPISGTYRGSLRQVLSRLLDGFSYYVADTADGRMEITVVGRVGARAVAPPAETAFQRLEVPPRPSQKSGPSGNEPIIGGLRPSGDRG
jgi:hypothetical protein